MTLQIIAMSEAHVAAARELTRNLNWPHRKADWRQALQLGEGLVAEQDGRLLGTIIRWRWGSDYATLGLVIVADDVQGKGIGKRLLEAALSRLPDCNVRLHATEAGKRLYEKLGFVATGWGAQHQCRELPSLRPVLPASGRLLRPARQGEAALLAALDTRAHGQQRQALIAMLMEQAERLLVLEEQGEVSGFASLRRSGHGYTIGPVICRDLPCAKALIGALLDGLEGQFVRIDTDSESGLSEWLTQLGLEKVDMPTAMIRGIPWQPEGMLTFALMSQAMA